MSLINFLICQLQPARKKTSTDANTQKRICYEDVREDEINHLRKMINQGGLEETQVTLKNVLSRQIKIRYLGN